MNPDEPTTAEETQQPADFMTQLRAKVHRTEVTAVRTTIRCTVTEDEIKTLLREALGLPKETQIYWSTNRGSISANVSETRETVLDQ